ncbi:NmrA family NAD(P)-binding protein [Actinocatenispora sera]|uniref:NmrA family NAD(P)-binding protein n=1 Tax=Actinocatenispora sera TaxID=390989 RepID=UPI0033FD747B
MILVTGAGGHLGSRILATLRQRDVPALGGSRGTRTGIRPMDFDRPDTIDLSGVGVLVLVSAGYAEDDQVIARHAAVLDAARRDGVEHVVYTSLVTAGDHLGFALAHRATERLIMDSGLAWTMLRNGIYAELFGSLMAWNAAGELVTPFGQGALAAVARDDLARAAATVAAAPVRHAHRSYDLVGTPITAGEVAAALGVRHRSISLGEHRAGVLRTDGLLPFQPPMIASIATSIRHGFLGTTTGDLEALLGRAPVDAVPVAAASAAQNRTA